MTRSAKVRRDRLHRPPAEMKQGYVEPVGTSHDGTYEIEWIPASKAVKVRTELGIQLSDF